MGEGEAYSNGPASSRESYAAVALSVLLVALGAFLVDDARSWGWDESMHAELPAARIALALRAAAPGEALDAVLECQQYPFAFPAFLGAVQFVAGVDEGVARGAARALWGLGLLGLFLLGSALVRDRALRGARLVPWLAIAFGVLCPLAWSYSGTLFLEAPFTVATTYALWAWLRRDGSRNRELLAGTLATIAFFTRFNHGGLLGLGLLLALLAELATEARAGRLRAFFTRVGWLALVPALALAWWFVLPLPQGLARAAEHRAALLDFLGGNLQLDPTPWSIRIVHWCQAFAPSPRFLLLLAGGVVLATRRWRDARVRTLLLVLAGMLVPQALHPFHLDRFLLPLGPSLWALAALGIAGALPARPPARAAALAALSILTLAGARLDGEALFSAVYGFDERAEVRAVQERVLAEWRSLSPAKPLPTAGYWREEADGFLDLAAAATHPRERVAWLGIQPELSPAAIHLGLLARDGDQPRFRRDAHLVRPDGQPEMCVTFTDVDPGWGPERLREWASGFDVVITTSPIRIKRQDRAFLDAYQGWLVETGEWTYETLGEVAVRAGDGRWIEPPVKVIACRRKP